VTLHQRGDAEAALRIYGEVLAREPDNAIAQHFLGVIHYQRGELAEALPLLERAAVLQRDEPEFHNNLGLALAAADRETEAVAEYRSALALKPDHAFAWNNLGLALQACNQVRSAIDSGALALDWPRAGTLEPRSRCCSTASSKKAGENTTRGSSSPSWRRAATCIRGRGGMGPRRAARRFSCTLNRASATRCSSRATPHRSPLWARAA
jgi:tetratricopeptide (TPR) repeat protein